jgi:hypothetical protein
MPKEVMAMSKTEIIQLLEGALGHFGVLEKELKDPNIIKTIREKLKTLNSEVGLGIKSAKQALALERKAAQAEKNIISPEDLATQFRSVVQKVQQEAEQGVTADSAVIMKSMEIEVKGLVMAREGKPTIVTASPDKPLDPGDVSTIRMSFGTVPVIRQAVTEQPKKPTK